MLMLANKCTVWFRTAASTVRAGLDRSNGTGEDEVTREENEKQEEEAKRTTQPNHHRRANKQ